MPIQVDQPKSHRGKLFAGGILIAVFMVVLAMPRFVRGLFLVVAALAAISAAWLFRS